MVFCSISMSDFITSDFKTFWDIWLPLFQNNFLTTVLQLPTSIVTINFLILEIIYIKLPLFIIFCLFRSLTKLPLIYQFFDIIETFILFINYFQCFKYLLYFSSLLISSYFIIQVFKQCFTNFFWLATCSYYSYLARPQSWVKTSIFSIPILMSVLEEIL